MARDETEFDRLLNEAREWEARDRARHRSFGMKEDGAAQPFPAASRAPAVTGEGPGRKAAPGRAPKLGPTPGMEPRTPPKIMSVLETAMKEMQAQAAANRAKRKGRWGWIWVPILLYFVFRHFVR